MTATAQTTQDLPRKLGVWDATAVVIGIVIGSGIFVFPNLIARSVPSGNAILTLWIVSGILSFLGALAFAELGGMMPQTGGQYVYLREAYGPLCGFVCAWTFMLAVLSGGSAWLAVTFSIFAGYFIALTPVEAKVLSVALIAVLSAINYIGVREGAIVQRIFTALKILGLVILIVSAYLTRPAITQPAVTPPVTLANFGVAMAACLMAYNGWSYVSFVAGEVTNPKRNLLRSLIFGMVAVGALYTLTNAAYLRLLTIPEIAAARIPFAQARDGLFFARFGRVHPRFKTPNSAIVWGGVWTAFLVLTGSYDTLYSYSIVAAWIFYTMAVAAVAILRRKMPDAERPYKMWGYPWTLWIFVLVSIWFTANEFVTQTAPSLMAFVIVATGVIAYWLWKKMNVR